MTPDPAPPETATSTPTAPPSVPAPGRLRAVPGSRKLMFAVVAVALLFGAQWLETRFRLSAVQEELARRLAESDGQSKEARAIARQNQEALQALAAKVGALEAQLAESQGQQLALESMYQELSKGRDDRVIAEVEQAVSIAAQQLQLAGNVEAALIALTGADARLARAASPQFLGVRKLIARDIERLRALPTADVPGMAMKLESVIASVDSMPLAFEQRPMSNTVAARGADAAKKSAAPEPAWWQRFLADAWAEFRQMVRIERIDHADPGLLSPQQSFFLRENLKLRLVNARLALLARDAKSFRDDMRQAQAWLERYFDVRAKPVQGALEVVRTLGTTNVAIEPPTLNETLAALRNFRSVKK
ncbi:uroporphyrinogen-III C-methyltransferase [Sulfurisoma sediminicola]|uniref:Uroporphyrin-3 C-methyltransferase n=1 Tax=Sulfurisoma sediminicola TaxID=1381557 RepID=A0A497X8H9_9PROT|nr:uroporphyrinogen-III C-methyltransferase [Sulfurisoma sediminicola]RLJ62104.1 uroporphyrin-3 C-methyltransferase [Sulfurisoma sediminicola]